MRLKYDYVGREYPIKCKGFDAFGKPAFSKPIDVVIGMHKSHGSDGISVSPKCPYNVGGHGQRCKASHPDIDKLGEGWDILCRYSCDLKVALGDAVEGVDEDMNETLILGVKEGTILCWDGNPIVLEPKLKRLVNKFLEEIVEKKVPSKA